MGMRSRELRIEMSEAAGGGDVGAVLGAARDPHALLALAHGAGAGMRHAFMDAICARLEARGVATLRYEFPYMAKGRRAPDRAPKLVACIESVLEVARSEGGELPLFAGGKSMGGRMTSLAASEDRVGALAGVVFLGFPLHAAGKPGTERAAHLADVEAPLLFVQGTRDKLADLELLEPVLEVLSPQPQLHVVDGADHGFHVLKRSGRSDEAVLDEIADCVGEWTREVTAAN